MLTQILPGFREIRGPLASGFLWILVGYLIFHGDIAHAHGKIGEIDDLGRKLNPAALAAVASFVAYLLGTLSEDVFGRALMRWLQVGVTGTEVQKRQGYAIEQFKETSEAFREQQIVRVENEADRLGAERDLRAAILPPLFALIVYLAISDRLLWLAGLVPIVGLGVQFWLRARDSMFAVVALSEMRRVTGVPPASAEEAAVVASRPVSLAVWAADQVRKARSIANTGAEEEWIDETAEFLRKNGPEEWAALFLTAPNLESQVEVLKDLVDAHLVNSQLRRMDQLPRQQTKPSTPRS